jgi:hypothetical protein
VRSIGSIKSIGSIAWAGKAALTAEFRFKCFPGEKSLQLARIFEDSSTEDLFQLCVHRALRGSNRNPFHAIYHPIRTVDNHQHCPLPAMVSKPRSSRRPPRIFSGSVLLSGKILFFWKETRPSRCVTLRTACICPPLAGDETPEGVSGVDSWVYILGAAMLRCALRG